MLYLEGGRVHPTEYPYSPFKALMDTAIPVVNQRSVGNVV